MGVKWIFISYLLVLGFVGVLSLNTQAHGEGVVQTRIKSIDSFEQQIPSQSAPYINESIFSIAVTYEVWNPTPPNVELRGGCAGWLIADYNSPGLSSAKQLVSEICFDYSDESRGVPSGVFSGNYWIEFYYPNYYEACVPDGTISLYYFLGVDTEHRSTIHVQNCDWTVDHDPIPDNWGETEHYFRNTLLMGIVGTIGYLIFYEIRGRRRVRKGWATLRKPSDKSQKLQQTMGLSPTDLEKL